MNLRRIERYLRGNLASPAHPSPAAATAAGNCGRSSVIYLWPVWDNCFAYELLPAATRIVADVADTVDGVLARLPRDAETFWFHVDLTFSAGFPACRERLIEALQERGISIHNAGVTDISKAAVQRYCREAGLHTTATTRDGDPDELLIVKTNLNAGAWTERIITGAERRRLGLKKPTTLIKTTRDYKVLPRKKVRPSWWDNPEIFIERYVNNRRNRIFRVYSLLDRLAVADAVNPKPVKKMGDIPGRPTSLLRTTPQGFTVDQRASDFPDSVVHAALTMVRRLSLSLCCMDIVMDDAGRCYITDVNTTPGPNARHRHDIIEYLRGALAASAPCGTAV